MSHKQLLILERSTANLSSQRDSDGSIILEGVFTEIGVKNKNNRIYEEKEVLPHINELQQKVKQTKLLGELDHPKDFDISLSNVSHVVEDLRYDSDKKQVIGKIRLLNTSKGKEAQALIQDGIPLHISSRAAGTVDESGKVKIKKFFTYDLVADPGFENAQLSRVNESFGFDNDSNLYIYELSEKTTTTEDKKYSNMEQKNYLTVEDFNNYTEYVKGVLESLKESKTNTQEETVQKLIKYTEHIAEKVNKVTDYAEYLAENVDKGISYSNYLAENVNKIKDYADYLGEELDNSIQYGEYVAEKVDQGIRFANYIGENLENSIKYSEYVAEKTEQNINYSNYIAENLDKGISYSNYLAENLEKGIKYSEYIAESLSSTEGVNESVINESMMNEYKESLTEKLNRIIESAKPNASKELHFMNFLTEGKRQEFRNLSNEKQSLLVESMNRAPIMSTIQAENVWNSCLTESKAALDFINDMPEKFRMKWEQLKGDRKSQIIAESKFYTLNTPYAINNFWQTRDLRNSQVTLESITESKSAAEQAQAEMIKESQVSDDLKAAIINRVKFNLGR
jgi:hypothetical protein